MKRLPILALIATVTLLSACRFVTSTLPPAMTPTFPAETPRPSALPEPSANPATTVPPSASEPATAVAATAAPVTAAPLFDVDPADRSVYAAGLTTAGQRALDQLPGAPVYHMAIALDESMTALSGRQTVTYTNQEGVPLGEVYFHLHPITLEGDIAVSDVTVDGAPVAVEVKDAVLRVPLPVPLAPGDTATFDMAFATTIPTDIGRNYGVLAYTDDILALAHFYPMLAVYDDEGWNIAAPDIQGDLTYSDPAFYRVRVTAPAATTLVGSGVITEEASGDGTQTVTYAIGPARDFYLAAGDFDVTSRTAGETTIHSYAPTALAAGSAQALEVAVAALEEHSRRLSPFPYRELDIVTTPTSALGIEYPGVIVGALRMYDVDSQSSSGVPFSAILESTTAHEVAHQWFYNLVGNDQLDEPWLDEAIVSYSTYRYYADRYGQGAADNYFQTFLGRWNSAGEEAIPIGLPVADYEEAEYGAIVYGRGPIFVRELEETMGRETFDAFLSDYVAQFTWQTAGTESFRALAEEHCGCDLGPLFAEWIYK